MPADNILHDYKNYAYVVELWACSRDSFNGGTGEGDEILISDAGLGGQGKIFDVDFRLDNIEIETIIGGLSRRGFAANAIKINFDIIEPYTVTLLDRLKKVADTYADKDIKTQIYLFKIKFVGYTEEGGPPQLIPCDKFFYFNMINMQFKITNRGAVYRCEAIPTNNMSMIPMLDNMIPNHLELQGKTINELFGVGNDDKDAKNLKNALNEWEKFKVKNEIQEIENKIEFEFSDGIGDAKILDPKNVSGPSCAIPGSNILEDMNKGRAGKLDIDKDRGIVKAHAGTRVVDFISMVIQTTDYMSNQVTQGSKDPVKLWKVYPRLQIKEYDKTTSFFSRNITFEVKAYEYSGLDHPNFGQAPPANIVKEYNYIFTGINKDVIKADLDFHMAFFDVRTTKGSLIKPIDEKVPTTAEGWEEWILKQTAKENGTAETKNSSSIITSIKSGASSIGTAQNTAANADSKQTMAVGELMTQLLDNAGDLVQLNLEIVGDPDWLLQEKPKEIDYIKGDVNFKFNFISPTNDYQENGLFDVGGDPGFFSGVYKVVTVKSSFRKGKFTQTLTNVRNRIQP